MRFSSHQNVHQNIEILKGKLFFSILRMQPRNSNTIFSYCVDDNEEFQYQPFFSDFGPPSLLQIHKFMNLTNHIIDTHKETIQFYCSTKATMIPNALVFICSYKMIRENISADEAFSIVSHLTVGLRPYRDASTLNTSYDLSVISCLRGLNKAMRIGWYLPSIFNVADWEKYELVEFGDMNWIIPGKLLAFASPFSVNTIQGGYKVCTPLDLAPVFKSKGINHVIRLCQRFYDEKQFTESGFKHTELYFLDGSVPPADILARFMSIIETDDSVALHCKAGLGRTYVFVSN